MLLLALILSYGEGNDILSSGFTLIHITRFETVNDSIKVNLIHKICKNCVFTIFFLFLL